MILCKHLWVARVLLYSNVLALASGDLNTSNTSTTTTSTTTTTTTTPRPRTDFSSLRTRGCIKESATAAYCEAWVETEKQVEQFEVPMEGRPNEYSRHYVSAGSKICTCVEEAKNRMSCARYTCEPKQSSSGHEEHPKDDARPFEGYISFPPKCPLRPSKFSSKPCVGERNHRTR
eukprot:gnl/TRDRNA2_/TRDRNA2_187036_c0_seq1.p1 gnl/TRDRNA2_/TRDRNA2_187036_c0~~gnl/TRDRNA2_/TRDRNA2_187036_c0_seq1.p1  ORF type:complete len:175 (+),score=13.33 gnl/TRDRNA2_/TRDRNA2_187036_c0_seq1:62-586(+)